MSSTPDRVLAIDVGTSGVRAAVVGADARPQSEHYREVLPSSPAPGMVEFDGRALAAAALEVARAALAESEPVAAVGITNQRASTLVWDRATGEPVAPGQGWQDLRTVGACLALREKRRNGAMHVPGTVCVHTPSPAWFDTPALSRHFPLRRSYPVSVFPPWGGGTLLPDALVYLRGATVQRTKRPSRCLAPFASGTVRVHTPSPAWFDTPVVSRHFPLRRSHAVSVFAPWGGGTLLPDALVYVRGANGQRTK